MQSQQCWIHQVKFCGGPEAELIEPFLPWPDMEDMMAELERLVRTAHAQMKGAMLLAWDHEGYLI